MNCRLDWKTILLGAAVALGLLQVGNDDALADDYICTGAVGAITVDTCRSPKMPPAP